MSTLGDGSVRGSDIKIYVVGYHEYIVGCLVHRKDIIRKSKIANISKF